VKSFARLPTVQKADAAEDVTITAAACWLGGISDDEVQSLLRERGEAVATLARLRACSWLAGSLVSGTTEVDAGGCSVSLSVAVDTPLIDLKFPWRDTWCKTRSFAMAKRTARRSCLVDLVHCQHCFLRHMG